LAFEITLYIGNTKERPPTKMTSFITTTFSVIVFVSLVASAPLSVAFAPTQRVFSPVTTTVTATTTTSASNSITKSSSILFSSETTSSSDVIDNANTAANTDADIDPTIDTNNKSNSNNKSSKSYTPIFDFTISKSETTLTTQNPINSFERIDDAIMGGISTSSLKFIPNKPYSVWSGVCRTDGGGFCGMRTLPFVSPLMVDDILNADTDVDTKVKVNENDKVDGLYISCRLASDNEPEKRIWKMTIRTDSQRGELVYQSNFELPKSKLQLPTYSSEQEWHTIHVPFNSFQQVRGPRIVQNGAPLDISGGIYQIGMTMSKFQMGLNTTELIDFRPGFFELHIQSIGLYSDIDVVTDAEVEADADADTTVTGTTVTVSKDKEEEKNTNIEKVTPPPTTSSSSIIETITKQQMLKKRPLLLKIVLQFTKLFFSEKANRRKSAMKILQSRTYKRSRYDRRSNKMNRFDAIVYGYKYRARSVGSMASLSQTIRIIGIDVIRTVLKYMVKLCIIYPFKFGKKVVSVLQLMTSFGKKNEGDDGKEVKDEKLRRKL
jgi:hypothetical protein